MLRTLLLVFALVLLPAIAQCEQRYNGAEGRWETVPDGSDWSPRYNPMEGDFSYQPSNARTEYNAMEGRWDWNSGHNPASDD
jgi:hypothetical protein